MHVIVLAHDERIVKALDAWVPMEPAFAVQSVESLTDIERLDSARRKVFLFSREVLAAHIEREPVPLARVAQVHAMILALARDELLGSIGMLEFVHGWLFHDAQPNALGAALSIALAGYCLMPEESAMASQGPYVAVAAIPSLTQVECVYLMELGKGFSNSLISRRIGLASDEAGRVRCRVLTKLRLGNGIEAGAFARRYAAEIANHRSYSFRLENLG